MTGGAGVVMHTHRVASRVTERDAGRGVSDQAQGGNAGGGMIYKTVLAGVVWMADQTAGRVVAKSNDVLNSYPGA